VRGRTCNTQLLHGRPQPWRRRDLHLWQNIALRQPYSSANLFHCHGTLSDARPVLRGYSRTSSHCQKFIHRQKLTPGKSNRERNQRYSRIRELDDQT
jgi:hypothetical protein